VNIIKWVISIAIIVDSTLSLVGSVRRSNEYIHNILLYFIFHTLNHFLAKPK